MAKFTHSYTYCRYNADRRWRVVPVVCNCYNIKTYVISNGRDHKHFSCRRSARVVAAKINCEERGVVFAGEWLSGAGYIFPAQNDWHELEYELQLTWNNI